MGSTEPDFNRYEDESRPEDALEELEAEIYELKDAIDIHDRIIEEDLYSDDLPSEIENHVRDLGYEEESDSEAATEWLTEYIVKEAKDKREKMADTGDLEEDIYDTVREVSQKGVNRSFRGGFGAVLMSLNLADSLYKTNLEEGYTEKTSPGYQFFNEDL